MKNYLKGFALVVFSMSMAACSGGGGGGGGGPSELVDGDFLDAYQTGYHYLKDRSGNGTYGDHCVGQNTYFETKDGRVRVYGSTAYSETDFRVVATYIDRHIDPVLNRFGMTWPEFVAKRQLLTSEGMEDILTRWLENDGTVKPALKDAYDSWSISDPTKTFPYWSAMTESEQYTTLENIHDIILISFRNGAYVGGETIPQVQNKDSVIACLNPAMGGGTFGEGTRHGIVVPPNSSTYDSSAGTLIKHELVHFVQENMTRTGGLTKTLPRWFSEGQAIVFSGMNYYGASRHYDFSPVNVTGPAYETISPNEAYKHYGLAYKYLDNHNTTENMTALMWEMRDSNTNPLNSNFVDGQFIDGFIDAFDAAMLDHNGNALTFENYRTNYHDIMNTQY